LTEASRLEKELAGAQAERTRSEDWLRGHAADAALSAEWPRWKAALLRHAGTVRELLQVEKSLAVIVKKAKEAAMQRASTEAEEQRAGEGLAKAEETVSAASAAAAELDLATLRPEAEVLACRLETLCELDQLTRKAAGARDAGAAAREDARVASDVMDKTRADRDRLALDQTKAEARLEAAREALTRIEAALSQDERRHALRDGDPCPLCGATEHPYARNAPGRSALEDQKAAVKREHTACKELELQVSTAEKHRAIAEERAKAAGNEERQHLKELSDATAQYAETCRGAQEADLPDRPEEAVDAVAGRRAKVERVLAEARRKQDQAIALAEAAKRAGKVLEGARKTLEEARKARAVADKAATDLAGQEERLEGDLRRLTLERTGIEAELDPPLVSRAAWREEARPDGAAFLRACERTASSFQEREASLERAAERAEVIQPRLEAARALLGEREARLRESAALAEAAGLEVRRLGEERILVLGGRMVREVEADLRHAEDKAAQSLEMARSTLGGAERAHAAAQQAARSAGDLLEQAREAEAKASAMLAQAMGKLGIDGPTLEARLAHDRQWMERRRSELDQLRLGLERAEATFSERQRLVQEHAESGQPELGPAEAQTTLREAEGRESETARALMEAQVALRQDADNRKALEAIGTELAVQEAAAARWTQLAEAIGSSDGKKFRVFAQSLALEALVANANAHLRELAPRYQLQRVPSTDLELQIADQDQGGEVRSVNSLSGGESFLVSLALALGLSSLSTRATHARTLFIDEGFGTLDRDTLEHAMVALEGLRSTGRTIGVISHVPELHERIGVQVLVEPVGLGRSRVVGPVAC
ncbi:MAG TPA: SbcC/MukB-like Walker B domain-containing protein, partial [Anaeromyxobacteraceae bacterium]|nr:SbcC/MukB-like Walker B domain-containing protein [Anaeromyxobacteraceae bacterium]